MTSNSVKKKERCNCSDWIRQDRSPNGTDLHYHYFQCRNCHRTFYPPTEAQKLIEYSKAHIFFFVEDWIMAWMYALKDAPIAGITTLQKHVLIITHEFAPDEDIPSENPGFKGYKFGPYTERIDEAVDTLTNIGYIQSYGGRVNTRGERLRLTEEGLPAAEKVFIKLSSIQQEKLIGLRKDLQQYSTDGIMRRVYSDKLYADYLDKSEVFERTLRRKRVRK